MKLLALLALLAMGSAALAQVGLPWPGPGGVSSAPSGYVGPGDIASTSFTVWGGLRAYNNAKANGGGSVTAVLDVRGSTTATSCTIFLKGDGTGDIDLTTAGAGGTGNQCLLGATTFCTSTNPSCTISKLYDQTGGGRPYVQATTANQPTLTFSCLGSFVCIQAANSNLIALASSSTYTPSSTLASLSIFGNRSAGTTGAGMGVEINSTAMLLSGRSANANQWTMAATSGSIVKTSVADATWHAGNGVINGANPASVLNIDGSETTGTVTYNTTAGSSRLPEAAGTSTTGLTMEGGFADGTGWSGTTRTSLCNNISSYWLGTTPC